MNFPKGKGAWMATVGEKGQIVIPKGAREMFGIHPGDSVLLLGDIKRGLALLAGDRVSKVAEQIFGAAEDDEEGGSDEGGRP